jgi:hypothetical protein
MARRSRFAIIYAPETYTHLDWIELKYHRLVATTISEQLAHTPATETRNRKPLVDECENEGPVIYHAQRQGGCGIDGA